MPLRANNLIIYFKPMSLYTMRSLYHMTYYLLFDSNCCFMFIMFILNQISLALCNVTHPDRGWSHVRKPSLRNNILYILDCIYLYVHVIPIASCLFELTGTFMFWFQSTCTRIVQLPEIKSTLFALTFQNIQRLFSLVKFLILNWEN